MPLYSCQCGKCDKKVGLPVGFSAEPACQSCGSRKMTRPMSRPAAPGKTKAVVKAARAQVAREGHLSNFSRSERER
jgi:hypothetical protein